jgi:hypothetical protein
MSPRPTIIGLTAALALLCASPPAHAYPDGFGSIDELFAFFGRIVRYPGIGGNQEFGAGLLGGRYQPFRGMARVVDWNRFLAQGGLPIAHTHPWLTHLQAEGELLTDLFSPLRNLHFSQGYFTGPSFGDFKFAAEHGIGGSHWVFTPYRMVDTAEGIRVLPPVAGAGATEGRLSWLITRAALGDQEVDADLWAIRDYGPEGVAEGLDKRVVVRQFRVNVVDNALKGNVRDVTGAPSGTTRIRVVPPSGAMGRVPRDVLVDLGLIRDRAWWNPLRYRLFNNRATRFAVRAAPTVGRAVATVKAADTLNTMATGARLMIYEAQVNRDRNAMIDTLAEPGGFDRVDINAHLRTRFAEGMKREAEALEGAIERGPAIHDLFLPFLP